MTPWLWAFYFAVKLVLHERGALRIHFLWNLALLALAMPLSPRPPKKPLARPWRFLRAAATIVLGFALFWYDSYLPPFWYSLKFAAQNPDVLRSGFMSQFLAGFVGNIGLLAGLAVVLALFVYAGRRGLHATPIVLLALLIVPIQALREPGDAVAASVSRFYDAEKKRTVTLPKPDGKPFDVILIQVCSLSWDDLAAVGVPKPRLLEGASYVFKDFNSATSYSTPAGLRLLRAPCGQVAHKDLYDPWPKECGLLDQLRAAGFKTYAALNTQKDYFEMAADLKSMAGLDEPVSVDGLPVKLLNFDDHPIYGSGDVLQRWWDQRVISGEPRAALFFNTLALHGGVHEDKPGWWKDPTLPLYVKTLDQLGQDVDALSAAIESSGLSAMILIVPEHGRAIRGSIVQAEGLRDIPMPPITRVPAAVRFVGPAFAGAPRGRESAKPVSYLALAQLLADVLADPGVAVDGARLDRAVAALPETQFLSETSEWKVFELAGAYYLYGKDKTWRPLPAGAADSAGAAIAEAK
jgi:hypothetical protein